MRNKKRAFTLLETTIAVILSAILVAIAATILSITVFSATQATSSRDSVIGYDIFVNDFVYFTKHAALVQTEGEPITRIVITTHSDEIREFSFENNRLRVDDYAVMKAKQGYFTYDGRSIMVSMKPDNLDVGSSGIAPVEMRVNIDCIG